MELTQLTFAVDTTPLDTADKKIRGLGEALKTIKQPLDDVVTGFDGLGDGIGKGVGGGGGGDGSNGPLVRPLKTVKANLEKVSTAMKIFRGETVDVGNEVVNLGSSFTKSQANFLALQKQLGASADQLKSFAKEFNDFNKITSANTFDNSIAGVQRLTKDIRELSEVNKLAAANTTLTRDQVMNLVRDTERLQQAMQSMGKSNDEINASIAQQTQQYVNLANEKNKLIAQTKAMEDSARAAASAELERAKASAYVTKEAEKLAFVNAQLKEGFTVGSANALYKYKEALDLTAMSADQAKAKLAAFGEQLKSKQSSSPFAALAKDAEETRKQVNHLARDVSVQLGDIAISLAGGQNPFMVMIQQGDQIRGALMRAKDSGVDSSNAIRNALGMMADSFIDVGKMVGTFFVGSIESAGNAVKRLVAEKTFLGAAIDSIKTKLVAQGEASSSSVGAINKLGSAFTMLAGAGIVGATLALGTFVVAQLSAIKESDNLVRVLETQGAAFGMSKDQVIALSESFSSISSSSAIQFMTQLAAAGGEADSNLKMLTEAAVNLEKYGGASIEKTAKAYADLSEKPLEGLIKIAKETGQVSQATLDQAASLALAKDKTELVELAQRAYAEAIKSTGDAVEQNLSPLAKTWIGIKDAMSLMFDEFKRSDSATTALTAISYVASGVHKVITGIVLAIQTLGIAAGATVDLAINQVSNIFDAEKRKSEHKRIMQAMQDSVGDAANSMMNSWMKFDEALFKTTNTTKTLSAEQRKANSQAADEFEKNTKVAQEWSKEVDKAKAKSMSLAELEAKNLSKLKNATQDQIKLAKEAAKVEFDSYQKKSKGTKPKETFSIATDNTITETKKSLDTQLKLVKEFENNRRDALKNAYESGIISRGEYLAQETAMTIDAFESQQQVIDKYQQYLDSFNQRRINIIKSYDDAIAKGGNKQELTKQLSNELANLDRAANGASETLDAMRASLSAATDKRFTESWKESNKALMESKKAYEEFESTVNNANQERQSEIQLQIQLSSAHGAEAEAIKASTAAMKSYAPAINKMALELRKAQQEYDNFMKSIDYSDDSKFEAQMLDAARLQKNLAQQRTNYNNAVALARQDSEQAATDASTKYQIEKYNELKGTLSDSIYTALFEGGKKGGDVLKNYLMKEFKNFAIKVFIEPIVGSIMGSFAGASGASGSSGGGGVIGTIGNVISTGSTVMKMLTNPMVLGNQMAQGVVAVGDALFKAGFEQMGNAVTGWASTANASAILGSIGSVVGGYGISKLIGNGYKTGLGNAVDIAGAIGSYFFGPIAGVVSGLVNRAFGRKLKDVGIQGVFGSEGFSGEAYRFEKGGWLRSNKTTLSELDPNITNSLTAQYNQLKLGTAIMAVSLGAGVESIENFTSSIKVSFKGLNEEEIGKKLEEAFGKISDAMSAGVLRELAKVADPAKYEEVFGNFSTTIKGVTYTSLDQINADLATWKQELESGISVFGTTLSDSSKTWIYEAIQEAETFMSDKTSTLIKDYQQYGETFTETLSRLTGSLLAVNGMFELLGQTVLESSLKGADAAYKYAESFGGIEQFNTKFGNFYDKFFTESEKLDALTNQTTNAFKQAGLEMPKTREEFKKLVQSNIALGQASAETTNFLLTQANAIDTLLPATEDAGKQLSNLTKVFKSLSVDASSFVKTNFSKSAKDLFETLGLGIEEYSNSIADVISGVLTGKVKAEDAGTELANAAVGGITNAIAQSASQVIAAQFVSSVITPVLANIMADVADPLQGVNIEQAKVNLQNQTEKLKIVLNTLGIDIGNAIDGFGNILVSSAKTTTTMIANQSLFAGVQTPTRVTGNVDNTGNNYIPTLFSGVQGGGTFQPDVLSFVGDIANLSKETADAILKASEIMSGAFSDAKSEYAKIEQDAADVFSSLGGDRLKHIVESGFFEPWQEVFAETELNKLVSEIEKWKLAKKRLLAAQDYSKLIDETKSTRERIDQLRTSEGLDDPVSNLKKLFEDRMKEFNNTFGKTLSDSISLNKSKIDALKNLEKLADDQKQGSQSAWSKFVSGFEEIFGSINKYQNPLLEVKTALANLNKELSSLTEEQQKHFEALTDWYNSQKELLAAEILVDINKQIKELESADQGPLSAIKVVIEKYINDLKALDQLTPEIQAQIDKLSSLQLGKARADLYNQLLPDEVVKQNALADLTKQFTDLGQKLPATTADFKTLIDGITDQNLKDKLLELIPAFIGLQDAVESIATVTDVTAQTVQDAYDKIKAVNKTAEDVANERISLEERLFNATATTAQAAEAARNAIHPLNLALYDSVIAAENAKAAAEERKGLEVELLQLLGNTTALRERELEALDASNRALQQQIWALEDARDATDKALAALERATAEQIKQLEKTFTATDLAMQVLEKAVDKEKQRLQEQLQQAEDSSNALKKVFDTLEKAIKSLRGQVDQTSGMQVQEARATLSSALASGIPSDTTTLEDAVGVLKADVEKGLYATSYDKSRAFLTLASDLENLKKNSEPQLTAAEQQVKLAKDQIDYLDDLLTKAKDQISGIRDIDASLFGIDKNIQDVEKAQSQLLSAKQAEQEARQQIDKLNEQLLEFKTQVEILRGIDNSVIDVKTAVDNVKTAINTEMQAMTSATNAIAAAINALAAILVKPTTSSQGVTTSSTTVNPYSVSGQWQTEVKDPKTGIVSGTGGMYVTSDTKTDVPLNPEYQRQVDISRLYVEILGRPADLEGLNWYKDSGKPIDEIAKDLEFAKSVGAYADGGRYPGGLALVGEEGPELINFSNPGMVYTAAQSANLMQGDNSDLVAELQALRQEVVMLRAEVRADVSHNAKTAKLLDRVIPDGQSIQVTTAA